ncbi:hypothetical protein TRFO_26142 [Tritrichomonas foetus]|uniref:Uncharacterized protein n=1 Tax=Tritrichomonas foetus TaxID=1144522 RepID=A0A1J4K894_9EUKA|nr:hypothetical protein TRFO_26142 [Tritrichomonas foetus]|eukprot:OHT05932.1 hypothetical protein TRFO_26142 [Tritrichomonas foetus]
MFFSLIIPIVSLCEKCHECPNCPECIPCPTCAACPSYPECDECSICPEVGDCYECESCPKCKANHHLANNLFDGRKHKNHYNDDLSYKNVQSLQLGMCCECDDEETELTTKMIDESTLYEEYYANKAVIKAINRKIHILTQKQKQKFKQKENTKRKSH